VPHYYDRISKGFEAAYSWLEQLLKDYGDYLGRVGSTNFMQQVVRDCSTCFDWDYFLEQQGRFQDCHRDAFMRLFQSLLPQLRQITWPDPEDFPYVERQWFPQSKRVGVEFFYLVRRLQKEYPNRPDWKEIIGYHVEPVVIPAAGRASGLIKFFPSTVVSLIFGYLEGFPKAFYVKAESLRKLGFASAARGARKQASHYRGGYWAAIKTNPKLKVTASFYGKMVRVVGVHTRVHLANVSASLDLEPQLNAPLQSERTMRNPGGHVWHAAMIHHRCKMLTICDSACERYFSLLHSIFDEDRSLAPHRMANRLLLREASVSCLGGARDEALIDQLAEILMSQFGKKPLKRHSDGKSVSWKMQELAAQSNVKAQNKQLSLFGDANLGSYFQGMGPDALSAVQDLAKKHAPATLDPDSSERAKRARQDALPLFVEDQRTTRKARAPSTMQEKLNQWLQSNDGEGWLQSRRDLEPGSGSSRFQLFDQ
jgi:hypothetical protein